MRKNFDKKNWFFRGKLNFRPYLGLGNYDHFFTFVEFPFFVCLKYSTKPKISKLVSKFGILWAKRHWQYSFCIKLYTFLPCIFFQISAMLSPQNHSYFRYSLLLKYKSILCANQIHKALNLANNLNFEFCELVVLKNFVMGI